jgi:hypothetical protein
MSASLLWGRFHADRFENSLIDDFMSLQPTRTPIVPDCSQFVVEEVNGTSDVAGRLSRNPGVPKSWNSRLGNPVD